MKRPGSRQLPGLLAAFSRRTDFSVGCSAPTRAGAIDRC
ncbi:MAG: hypothetical protein ACRD21_11865 [Vicinamibacteria bacterium]